MTSAATASTSQLANAIRALAMDAVEAAKSGHPGMPMGMAEIAVALWTRHLAHDPANAKWANRDRFVVSNGHGSMLLYALLHLTGYDLPMEELKRFRQLHSKTPGHPEFGLTPGVETTTGPLGQGLANAVGMALAERLLAAEFNRPGHAIVDHRTYVFVGDGCLMEGISHEACSLAGTWGLGKLMVLYDDNGISIDGETKGWFTDDTAKRFEAYGWNVIGGVDGHDVAAVDRAIAAGRAGRRSSDAHLLQDRDRQGRAQQGRHRTRCTAPRWARRKSRRARQLGWPYPPFEIPDASTPAGTRASAARSPSRRGRSASRGIAPHTPSSPPNSRGAMHGELPADWRETANAFVPAQDAKGETVATRKASQQAIEAYAKALPEMIGGSADLTGSVFTNWSGSTPVTRDGRRQLRPLRRARVRDVRDRERHGAARRPDPVCRHLPHVFRLRPQCAADGGADEAAIDLRVHARFDRTGRGRADAPVGRARGEPAPHSEHGCLAALRHRGDRRRVGRGDRARGRPRRACCSRGRTCRSRRAMARRSRRFAVAATCWPTGTARARSAR